MAESEIKNEIIEETAETTAPVAEENAVVEEKEVKGTPVIAKIRQGITNFLWVFPIIFLVLSALLIYKFGQNLLTFFDYSLKTKTIENIAYNIEDLFVGADETVVLPLIAFLIVAIIYVVFTIINVIRAIGFIFGIFGMLGKDEEKKIKRFGKLSRSFLASYALYFELLLIVRMGDHTWLNGGKSVMIITSVAYFVIAVIWQLVSAEDKNAFDWKKEAFNLIRALIRPAIAVFFAIFAIPDWFNTFYYKLVETINTGLSNDQIIPITVTFVCGLVQTLVLSIMVRKTFKNGAIRLKKSETKWTKDPDDTLFADGIVYLIFALIKAVGMSLGGLVTGGGLDTAILISELKLLIIPFVIFLSIIALTKFTSTEEK